MDTVSTSEELVRNISDLPDRLGAAACFGAPVERDGHTIIPVARISFGYGLGFGRGAGSSSKHEPSANGHDGGEVGEGEGGGGGGGGSSSPVAVIDISRDEVEIKPIQDPMRLNMAAIALGAWVTFWFFATMRTIARERRKIRVRELKGQA